MELNDLQKQIEALAEEVNKLRCTGADCNNSLTEAEDDEVEEVKDEEKTITEVEPEGVDAEAKDEVEIEEEPSEEDKYAAELVNQIGGNLLRTFMDCLNEINTLAGDEGTSKYADIINEVKDNTNKIIGSLQAVLGDGSEDAAAQAEAREEAENQINGESVDDEVENADKGEVEEVEDEEELEVIKPIEDEDETEVKEDEVEEVEEVEDEEKNESLKVYRNRKNAINESISITDDVRLSDFDWWGPAVDHVYYLFEEAGDEVMEQVLRDTFGDDHVFNRTELNDFFAYYAVPYGENRTTYIDEDEFYGLFGVKNPYADELDESCESHKGKKLKESLSDADEEIEESCNKSLKESLSDEDIVKLRKEVVVGSLYTNDFENSFGLPARAVQDFFDGYLEELGELMEEDGIDDADFWDYIDKYDNDENLINYYNSVENPFGQLPVENEDDEDFDESINPDDNPDDITEAKSKFHKR